VSEPNFNGRRNRAEAAGSAARIAPHGDQHRPTRQSKKCQFGAADERAQAAAGALGLKLQVLHASSEHELDTVFASLRELQAGALVVGPDTLFITRAVQLAALSLRRLVPTATTFREFVAAGGLMSYGGSITDGWRLAGVYTGRVLKGEKPADLPVQQTAKVELIINLKTAKALGLTVPLSLVTRADEVIE
jgi:putative ABC transport system substrate-binding protein